MVNYTVIIPHRNEPELLERCLASIPERDDLEIIVIDDNSDKPLVNFDDFPGYNRGDVKIIFTKEGRGSGYCRNIGMSDARGVWLLFANASDFFTKDAFQLFDQYKDSANEIVFFGSTTVKSDNITEEIESCRPADDLYLSHRDFRAMRYLSKVPWAKLVKTEMVRKYNICFDLTRESEDVMFSLRSGYHANKIDIYKKSVYVVVQKTIDISEAFSSKILLTKLRVSARRNDYIRKHNIPAEETYVLRHVYNCMTNGKISFLYLRALLSYLWHQPNDRIINDYRKFKELKKRRGK